MSSSVLRPWVLPPRVVGTDLKSVFRNFAIVVLALAVPLAPREASAHSQLEESSPGNSSTVARPVRRITLRFNEEVSLPRVVVRPTSGKVLAGTLERRGDSEIVAYTPRTPLGPGTYRVQWKARSADGHWVSGTFSFTVL